MTPTITEERDLADYASKIKKQKEEERREAESNLEIQNQKLKALESETEGLLTKLFDISDINLERCKENIAKLKPLTKERVEINMEIYRWETKINQLKYI